MPDPEDQPTKALESYPDWPSDPEKVERQIIAERKLGDLKPGAAAALLMAISRHLAANEATPADDVLDPETTFPRPEIASEEHVARIPPTQAQREARGRQHQAEEPEELTRKSFNDDPYKALMEITQAVIDGRLSQEAAKPLIAELSPEMLQLAAEERISGTKEEEPRHHRLTPNIFDQPPRKRGSFGDSLREGGRRGLEMARGSKPRATETADRALNKDKADSKTVSGDGDTRATRIKRALWKGW